MNRPAARKFTGGLFVLMLLLGGCAAPLQSRYLSPSTFPDPVEIREVAFFPQEEYHCGPAALAMALDWAGKKITPHELAPAVYLPSKQGSLQLELLSGARRYGAIPYVLRPQLQDLLAEIAAGHPVIVFQNLGLTWYPKWHYAVAIGFDVARNEIVLRSGLEARHVVSLTVFERTWRRADYWAVVVLPPARLPRTAEETPYLQAILALERLKHWEETSIAYQSALARWPSSLAAQLGLGNSRYALRDFTGAERAFRAATLAHPDSGIAFNNLAQTLADEGRWNDAEVTAEKAIVLGGPHIDTYRTTLTEIRSRRTGAKPAH